MMMMVWDRQTEGESPFCSYLVARAYMSWCSLSIQIPSSFDRTEWVSNSFRFRISTSGSQRFRRI